VSGLFSKETRARIALRPGELRIVLWAGAYFFFVLASWSLLRPVREQMGIAGDVRDLKWLFLVTWGVMLLLQPLYGRVVAVLPRRRFVPLVYRFFAVTLFAFFLALTLGDGSADLLLGRAFFVWSSVFNLWVVSVFWSFMADHFGSERAKRLYPWIAVGGTLGSIMGGLLTWGGLKLVMHLDGEAGAEAAVPWLLLGAIVLLEIGVQCVHRLRRLFETHASALGLEAAVRPPLIGGSAWAGLREVMASPYLLRICLYLLCYTFTGTLLYFVQADIVKAAFETRAERTQAFAIIDIVTQGLTLFVQVFVTRRLVASLGLGGTLAILPVIAGVSFLGIWALPAFGVVVLMQSLRRAARYAITKPTREVLFSVLEREEKYKAKAAIDTFVYRTGDAVGAGTSMLLGALAPGLAPVVLLAVPLSAGWAYLGRRLGRDHAARSREGAEEFGGEPPPSGYSPPPPEAS